MTATEVRSPVLASVASVSPIRLVTLVLLFSAAPLLETTRLTALSSVDVWWHLRTGLWILQQHAFPRTGLFSQYSNLPWHASNWLYDLSLAALFKIWGLRAIVILLMVLKLALAWATYRLARAAGARFWLAVALSAASQYVIPALQPVSSSLSIVFLGLQLLVLVESRRSGSVRPLFWFPALFLAWANLDLQVVLGLTLLLLFALALACEEGVRRAGVACLRNGGAPLRLKKVGAIAGLSLLCTLANPYTFHIFVDVVRSLYNPASFQYVAEMRAMSFRRPQDYLLMLLVMTAFLALGRRRSLEVFEPMALVAGTLLAFRIQRDAWVAVLPAIAVIGAEFSRERRGESLGSDGRWRWRKSLTAIAVAAVFFGAVLRLPPDKSLLQRIGRNFPVQACDFIGTNHLSQPIFNAYSWGGFLTWYLPDYPVSVDSRADLYGDEILERYFEVVGGTTRPEADPAFASAQMLLLERQSGMVKALTEIPVLRARYRMVYNDDLAAVFVRQSVSSGQER